MKNVQKISSKDALSLIEVLAIIAVIFLLVLFLLPALGKARTKADRIYCVSHLKQIGLAFRIYAGENRDRYPMNISTNDVPVVNEATAVFNYLELTTNILGTPKILICPTDKSRKTANNFSEFSSNSISYFVGLDASENLPQTMLSGDRNITNGFPPKRGILELTTNQMVAFTEEVHVKQGNIALGDGSVQQVSSARLRSDIIPHTGFLTNRIKLP